ncbi:DUF6268 family outer membrane beta-barrel protein [Aquimarina gracilis]|uniref:DUF6268 family outer membrane beta-barrel protein n=1 Tax=Aquimarina gracilis TaxID=874422 RepID=A0ABU5ZYQ5_9FLAO|nr:DUF6268 family outer membrane beta-barrel protein [Aquimarina gracilis]MEB3347009.1 DUF6268 family outer membrane beta-barrel protein [Aquimarina gracilis]
MQRHFNFIILVFGTVNIIWSQNPNNELAGFEYITVPDLGDASVEKYSLSFNLGKKFKKRAVLGLGIFYDYHEFTYTNASLNFDTGPYVDFHTIKTKLFFKYFIDTSWSANVMFAPLLSSNFEESISSEDVILSSAITLSKSWKTKAGSALLTFGVGYGPAFGKPQLIPVVSFKSKIDETWSYSLGSPKTTINYRINPRHSVSAVVGFNGLFGNVSSTTNIPEIGLIDNTKLQYNSLDTGINYLYRIQPNWTTIVKLGYSPWNQLKILDNENNEIYDFEPNGSVFISMGLKYNLNK